MKSLRYFCKVFLLSTVIFGAFAIGGCTDAQQSKFGAYGNKFKVTLYSGGQPVKTWTSTGKVESEEGSDGWYFTDENTKKLVRISGSITIEQQ